MGRYGDEELAQAEHLLDAIERSGLKRKQVAHRLGVAYTTLDGWIRGEHRIPVMDLGRLTEILGPWFLNDIIEPRGFRVIRLRECTEESDPFESIKEAALRLGFASGRVAHDVAEATDPQGPGGALVTVEEKDHLRSDIREARAFLDAMEERLEQTENTN